MSVIKPAHGRHHVLLSVSALALTSAMVAAPAQAAGDRDRDGMPNRWESRHGLNPDRKDAAADRDNDGLSNLREYRRHGDPRDEDTDNDGHDDGDDGTRDGDEDSDRDGVDNEDEDRCDEASEDSDEGSTDDLVVGAVVLEVDLEDDGTLEEIELAR